MYQSDNVLLLDAPSITTKYIKKKTIQLIVAPITLEACEKSSTLIHVIFL
jgi:hypothetical protein